MYAAPMIITHLDEAQQEAFALEPVSFEKPPYDEDWLQSLIHIHPELVPAGAIEPCFDNLVPVLREYTLPSGYLDNLFVTPEGYPVLVEVKLWKNQESRRKVVAQILEYAKDFASLTCEDINTEIRKQLKSQKFGSNPLHELVSANSPAPIDEAVFVDRLNRNLREGRFLLLILGDGIRSEMAELASYLMHHSLRYAFGMVEIRIFKMPDGSNLALPQVIGKTQTIERHVTVVSTQGDGIKITAPPVISEKIEKTSLSTDEFYELMAKNDPQNVVWLKELLESLSDLPIDVQTGTRGESLMLKVPVSDNGQIQLMLFTPTTIQFWGVPNKHWKDTAWKQLSGDWLSRVSSLVPGSVIKTFASGADIKLGDKPLPISALRGKPELAEAIRLVLRDANAYFEGRAEQVA